MHAYESALKASSKRLEKAASAGGYAKFGIDWSTFIVELIDMLINGCNESDPKKALADNPLWGRGTIALRLQRRSKKRIHPITMADMVDMVVAEINAADETTVETLVA